MINSATPKRKRGGINPIKSEGVVKPEDDVNSSEAETEVLSPSKRVKSEGLEDGEVPGFKIHRDEE